LSFLTWSPRSSEGYCREGQCQKRCKVHSGSRCRFASRIVSGGLKKQRLLAWPPLKIDNPVCIPIMYSLRGSTKRKLKLWPGLMIGSAGCDWKSFAEARKHVMKTLHQQRDRYTPIVRLMDARISLKKLKPRRKQNTDVLTLSYLRWSILVC
jgi:hypothetical protein